MISKTYVTSVKEYVTRNIQVNKLYKGINQSIPVNNMFFYSHAHRMDHSVTAQHAEIAAERVANNEIILNHPAINPVYTDSTRRERDRTNTLGQLTRNYFNRGISSRSTSTTQQPASTAAVRSSSVPTLALHQISSPKKAKIDDDDGSQQGGSGAQQPQAGGSGAQQPPKLVDRESKVR